MSDKKLSKREEAMKHLREVTEFMAKRNPEGFAKVQATVRRNVQAAQKAGMFGCPPGAKLQ